MKTKENTDNVKNREYWIDAVRSFACLCVITTHAPIPNGSDGQSFISPFNYYAMGGASILFFMISGALILYKEKETFPFLKKRVSRIALPMVIWSIICLIIQYLAGEIATLPVLFQKIALIPFYPQVGTYWFIYVIFGIYLVTPILAQWLNSHSQNEIRFYLFLWGTTLLLPYLGHYYEGFNSIISVSGGQLYYFYGFLGFAVLGFYLRRYVNVDFSRVSSILVIAFVLFIPWLLYAFTSIPHDLIHNRISINIAALAICYFLMIKKMPMSSKMKNIFYDFAQHSFGIYLVHLLVMRRILWPLLDDYNIHYLIQIPLIVILTALLSYLIVHLISKLPGSKFIVGL